MIDIRPVLYTIGWLLLGLAVAMWAPVLLSISSSDGQIGAFLSSISITAFVAGALIITNRSEGEPQLNFRQASMLTSAAWIVLPAFGAIPFVLSTLHVSYTDAYFETVSGVTTTGSTVLSGLDSYPPSILIWRSLLQWLGGFGIIGMSIAILPFLRVGGMQLFRLESSDRSEKLVSRPEQLVLAIGITYVGLTAACTLGYNIAGMSLLEAVNHSMTTIATAGYGTHDSSFGYFNSPAIDAVATVFMFLSSIPFLTYPRMLRRGWRFRDLEPQIRTYFWFLVVVIGGLTVWLFFNSHYSLLTSLRYVAFNVMSVVTTTGFVSTDYQKWGSFAATAFFFLSFMGGCTGSSAGGIKMFRFEIIWRLAKLEAQRLIMPHRVQALQYAGQPIDKSLLSSVGAFVFAYISTFWICSLILVMIGVDAVTSMSSVATCLSNTGPGLGPIVGPAGNFAPLPAAAKWVLSLAMILGRLEVLVLVMLFTPRFYRD
ncbi:MAG TPA: TrkH family potassium uptake protein [Alphaproteobacteria bacterium]|nr:TrkH family potassium uptake protein [Alphaproteobacteria bacterium]